MGANKVDPIPARFNSAEEAGEFWDIHPAADYWGEMEESEIEFEIQERVFWVACKRFSGSTIRRFSTHHRTDRWPKV